MSHRNPAIYVCLALIPFIAAGCVHAARDTTGFAQNHQVIVDASFEDTWQAVKAVLRENELTLYTRDKRGYFEAFSDTKRKWFQPKRIKYTFNIQTLAEGGTRVEAAAFHQIYGVTPLTYPGWHDRKTNEGESAANLLEAIAQKLSATDPA